MPSKYPYCKEFLSLSPVMRNPDEGPGDGIQQRKSDLILAGVILVWGASRVKLRLQGLEELKPSAETAV